MRAVLLAGILAFTGALGGSASAATPTRAAASWSLQAHFGRLYLVPVAVSCASAGDCYALSLAPSNRETFLVSTNGGTSWSAAKSFPAGFVGTDLSCPAAGTCLLAGVPSSSTSRARVLYLTRTSGAGWSALSSASLTVEGLACHTSAFCVAGGRAASGALQTLVSTNLGVSWNTASAFGTEFVSPSCPSKTECFAVDGPRGLEMTTDGAKAWKSVHLPTITGMHLNGISCPTVRHCVAVGAVSGSSGGRLALVSDNGGKSWSEAFTKAPRGSFWEVACGSASHCVAVSASLRLPEVPLEADVSTDGGLVWKAYRLSISENLIALVVLSFTGWNPTSLLSCPTIARCVTAGGIDDYTTRLVASGTGGTSWTVGGTPAGALPYSLGCWSVGCVAGTFTNSGSVTEVSAAARTWSPYRLPFAALTDVNCVADKTCDALGFTASGKAEFVRTTDGGARWRSLFGFGGPVVSGEASLACPTAKVCYVAITFLNATTLHAKTRAYATADGGISWKHLAVPARFAATLDQLACPSTTTCVLTNADSAAFSKDSGATWSASLLPSSVLLMTGPSCGSSTSCLMMAEASGTPTALVTADAGANWTAAARFPTALDAAGSTSLACPKAGDCEVVGESSGGAMVGFATDNSGSAWSQQVAPSGLGKGGSWGPLTCIPPDRCEASAVGPTGDGYLLGLG